MSLITTILWTVHTTIISMPWVCRPAAATADSEPQQLYLSQAPRASVEPAAQAGPSGSLHE